MVVFMVVVLEIELLGVKTNLHLHCLVALQASPAVKLRFAILKEATVSSSRL